MLKEARRALPGWCDSRSPSEIAVALWHGVDPDRHLNRAVSNLIFLLTTGKILPLSKIWMLKTQKKPVRLYMAGAVAGVLAIATMGLSPDRGAGLPPISLKGTLKPLVFRSYSRNMIEIPRINFCR